MLDPHSNLDELRQLSNAYDQKILETKRRLINRQQEIAGLEMSHLISPKQKQKKLDPAVAKDLAKIQQKMNLPHTTPDRKLTEQQQHPKSQTIVNSPIAASVGLKGDFQLTSPQKQLMFNLTRGVNARQYEIGQDVEFEKLAHGESIPGSKNPIMFVNKMPDLKNRLLPKDIFNR